MRRRARAFEIAELYWLQLIVHRDGMADQLMHRVIVASSLAEFFAVQYQSLHIHR